MHAPIAGSGLNRPAPLYKRYTGHETLPPYQTNVLCYEIGRASCRERV